VDHSASAAGFKGEKFGGARDLRNLACPRVIPGDAVYLERALVLQRVLRSGFTYRGLLSLGGG